MKSIWLLVAVPVLAASCSRSSSSAVRALPGDFAAEPQIRVLLVEGASSVRITPRGLFNIGNGETFAVLVPERSVEAIATDDGSLLVRDPATGAAIFDGGNAFVLSSPNAADTMTIHDVPFGVGWWWEGREDRLYDGELTLTRTKTGKINVILALPVEEYLRGVVPSEIGNTSPAEALKAQAVAARSETMTALAEGNYAGDGYDICSDVNCQVYSGIAKRTEATDDAIRATRGVILSYGGKPIPAYYASNCGGFSEDVANVWPSRDRGIPCWSANFDGPGQLPPSLTIESNFREWIAASPDVYCNGEYSPGIPDWAKKNFRWRVETKAEDLSALLAKKKDIGRVLRIEPVGRGESGRMLKARFVGEKGIYEVGPELAIRQVWDPPLKSAAFIVEPVGDPARPDAFVILGAGYGHGVGMCQTGAIARALAGQDYRTILGHYYRGAAIGPAYD